MKDNGSFGLMYELEGKGAETSFTKLRMKPRDYPYVLHGGLCLWSASKGVKNCWTLKSEDGVSDSRA